MGVTDDCKCNADDADDANSLGVVDVNSCIYVSEMMMMSDEEEGGIHISAGSFSPGTKQMDSFCMPLSHFTAFHPRFQTDFSSV